MVEISRLTLTLCFFFFQAEDGIRDVAVTGVQTCALPICLFPVQPAKLVHQAVLLGLGTEPHASLSDGFNLLKPAPPRLGDLSYETAVILVDIVVQLLLLWGRQRLIVGVNGGEASTEQEVFGDAQ